MREGGEKTVKGVKASRRRMITEAVEMQDNMGTADKFRGEYGWRTIVAVEMQDNRDIRDGEIGRWIRLQRQRRGMGDRSDRDGEER